MFYKDLDEISILSNESRVLIPYKMSMALNDILKSVIVIGGHSDTLEGD